LELYFLLPWGLWGRAYRIISGRNSTKGSFRKCNVGEKTYIDPSVRILGWGNVRIGSNTTISEDVWFNVNHREKGNPRIEIGDNCHIGKRNFFSSGPSIKLGDYCFTGIDCHFLGCGHIIDDPFIPYLASGLTKGDIIKIGANCWLTTSVTVLEGVSIGHGSVIGARSVVTGNIPPFSIAIGNPCKIIKRFNFKKREWTDLKNWTEEMESLVPAEIDYIKKLKVNYPEMSLSLISCSKKFGWLR
jgi:acetyltransferase-like isoleucine patch superfamily enzyme